MNEILINNQNVLIKEYEGKRVITFKDIDMVHNRPEGTARKRFNDNKKHFIEGEDYFKVKCSEVRPFFGQTLPNGFNPKADVTLMTESGYLMLAKSLTDDLSWDVQRKLVNDYFTVKEVQSTFSGLSPQLQLLINIETQQKQQQKEIENVNTRLDNMVDVISLDKNSWRKDSQHLISKIATKIGGFECMKNVYQEVFKLVEERAGVALGTRLTNKRNRMAGEGVCKSKRDRFTKIDIIAEDKKLIEIYVAIVKEMAVKYGVC
jgi:gp34